MEKDLQIGDEVLIFNYDSKLYKQDDSNYVKGHILSINNNISKLEKDLGIKTYKVLGEDGIIYVGSLNKAFAGNSIIRTKLGYLNYIREKIRIIEDELEKLEIEKDRYLSMLLNILLQS